MLEYYFIALAAVLFTAISQLLLKLGALHGKENLSLLRSYFNSYTATGLALLFCVTLMNVYAFKYIELKMTVALVPLTFILVAMLAYWKLGEKFTRNQTVGSLTILSGILLFNL